MSYIIRKSYRQAVQSYSGPVWDAVGRHLWKPVYEDYDEALAFARLLNTHGGVLYFVVVDLEWEIAYEQAWRTYAIPLLFSLASYEDVQAVCDKYMI